MTKKYLYEVTYLDNREGDFRRTEVIAEDKWRALDEVYEDYYFGRLISIDEQYEITDESN